MDNKDANSHDYRSNRRSSATAQRSLLTVTEAPAPLGQSTILDRRVSFNLDAPLRYEVEVTDIRGPHLLLLCRSAAAATRLRFMANDLVQKLQPLASFAQVRELKLRIARLSTHAGDDYSH